VWFGRRRGGRGVLDDCCKMLNYELFAMATA
jgi:hypothetical protein